MQPKIPVIFEDDFLLVLDKPADVVSEDILQGYLAHRLDRDTSGVLVIAKNGDVLENLREQFRGREVEKEYLALVHGLISGPGLIDAPIDRNPKVHDRFVTGEGGKLAATKYEPTGNFKFSILNFKSIFNDLKRAEFKKLENMKYNQFTLLRCYPLTGRTHQIRVHLKYINHPIVSDKQYAGRKIYKLDIVWCPRQFLHASKIGFYHPETKEWREFESPLPDDLKNVLNSLIEHD